MTILIGTVGVRTMLLINLRRLIMLNVLLLITCRMLKLVNRWLRSRSLKDVVRRDLCLRFSKLVRLVPKTVGLRIGVVRLVV